jgi:DNA-binding CsgD family transcriptional regulator
MMLCPQMAFLKVKFGLTPAQSRLVLRLVAGDSLRLSAAALGIGYETARTTLKSVFRKTSTHRQAELVTMIIHAGLPSPTNTSAMRARQQEARIISVMRAEAPAASEPLLVRQRSRSRS